ncbi:P2X purinoceptor 4-like protein, partial [Leptotrombidium deliense]
MQYFKEVIADFIEYKTPKIVHIKNRKIGILNRVIQVAILIYVIWYSFYTQFIYAIVWKKGYQEFGGLESSVTLKVKGVTSTNYNLSDFNNFVNESMLPFYNRVWDVSDIVVPPTEPDTFFITTNLIITPNQSLSKCPESPYVSDIRCKPENNSCVPGKTDLLGNGPQTGKCVLSDILEGVHVCEIRGWCPVERDKLPLKNNTALLQSTNQFTVLINNAIKFPKFGISRRNIPKTSNATYLKKCRYNENNKECPVFILNDIVENANEKYAEIAKLGAVIAIDIKWDCNLDWNIEYCEPQYSFRRLDDSDAILAPGWNFRYSQYYSNETRSLYKA